MTLTIGICAYNEGKNIEKLLSNILYEQQLPSQSEIIVVCSGCTDNTVDLVKKYSGIDNRIKIFVEYERLGKASAINQIFKLAKGDFILFISADTLPHKYCFSKLMSNFTNPKVGLVCSKPIPINNENSMIGGLVQILWNLHDYVFNILNEKNLIQHASEAFCVRAGVVKKIPVQTINDDSYIALNVTKRGFIIKYEPQSCVSICGPQTITDYISQRRRVILGHYQTKSEIEEAPQYLAILDVKNPKFLFKMFIWLIFNYRPHVIFIFLYLEIVLNFLARIDLLFKKNPSKWSIATTTKNLDFF